MSDDMESGSQISELTGALAALAAVLAIAGGCLLLRVFQGKGAGYAAAILGTAGATAVCVALRAQINEMTVVLALLLVVLFVASVWEMWPALLASVLGAVCLNYFFLPPIYEFTIEDPKNWIALGAFTITALTAGRLSAWAKAHAAEAAASRSQARLASAYNRSLLEASLDPLLTIGRDGKINDVNAAAETVTGRSRAELIGTDFSQYFSEQEDARRACERVFRDGPLRNHPLELRHRDGHITSILYNGSLYRDADGNVIGVVAAARPIASYAAKPAEMRPDPEAETGLRVLVGLSGWTSFAVGVLSAAGLVFRIDVLKSVIPGHPVIKMNAAICLVLLGLALWLRRDADRRPYGAIKRLSGQALAGIVALAGLHSLTEYCFGWNLGIDQLILREPTADAFFSLRPGLVAPITAIDFLLLGTALILLDRVWSFRSRYYFPAQYLAVVTLILAMVGILDFVLGSPVSYTRIALQTAVALLILSLGLLCARPDRGLAALLASATPGGTLTRRLLPAAIVIPTLVGAATWNALIQFSQWEAFSAMIIAMTGVLGAVAVWIGHIVNRGDLARATAEATLHLRDVELREGQRLARLGSWWWEPGTEKVTWSEGLFHITGRDPLLPPPTYEEQLGLYAPSSSSRLAAAVEKAVETGAPYELDLELVCGDGTVRPVTARGEVERDMDGRVVLMRGTIQDITERKRAEEALRRINQAHRALSRCNEALIRAAEETGLLQEICRIIVEDAGYRFCWVGRAEEDEAKSVSVVAQAGIDEGYLATVQLTWSDSERGRGPIGACIRTRTTQYTPDIAADPRMTPWRAEALKRGYGSNISIPLIFGNEVFGALMIYAAEPGAFGPAEVALLTELAHDMAFGIETLRTRAERERGVAALREKEEHIRLLLDSTAEAICGIDLDGRSSWVNQACAEMLGYGDPGRLVGKSIHDLAHYALADGTPLPADRCRALRALREGQYVHVDDEVMWRADGTSFPVEYWSYPMRRNGTIVGAVETFQDITERKRAEREIRQLARLHAAVAELGQDALRGGASAAFLDAVVRRVAECLDVEYCKILERLPDGRELLLRAGVGWRDGLVGAARVGTGLDSQAGYTLQADEPVIVADLRTETRFHGPPLLREHDVVSGISVVISTGGGPYGVLGAHTRRQRQFTGDEVHFLQSVANVLGTTIERQRADQEILRINRAQRALSRCNQALVRASEEGTLLREICRIIVEDAGYRFCWVGRAEDDPGKSVSVAAYAGFEAGYLATLNVTWADSERGKGPTGTCIRTRTTQLAKDIATDPRMTLWRDEALKRGYGATVSIPLVIDSTIFGAIMIYAAEAGAFGTEEVAMLTELAADMAFGIQTLRTRAEREKSDLEVRRLNAELEQRVARRTAQLQAANTELEQARERETEIGFRIQQSLLLDQPPQDLPGLRVAALTIPSQRIDGDFYVFIRHGDDCLDVIVGDVMGKGVPAALLGAAAKSHILRALSDLMALSEHGELPEPREIVMLAHAELVRRLIELDSFVTLVYARFDVRRRRLDVVDCGHTGILHWQSRTGGAVMLRGDNLPLGVREGEIYDQVSAPFAPGDVLLFFSDGITEARDAAGELFGAERLEEFIRSHSQMQPAALVESIREAVLAYSGSAKLTDDLTTVAVRVEERLQPIAHAAIEIASDLKQLHGVREFVRGFCRDLPGGALAEERADSLELAVNEAASNIMKHAYHGRSDQWIHLEAEAYPTYLSVRLHHLGEPFDPAAVPPPPLDGSRDSGFGAYIISSSVDEVRYYRDERGRNCIALVKLRKSLEKPV